jgi:betaine-aldehyde dehydrogenase
MAAAIETLLIDGKRISASSDDLFDLTSPVDDSVVARIVEGTPADVTRAVDAAERAFAGEWRRMSPRDRRGALLRLAALIREHSEELATLESRNVGKPISDSRDEAGLAADVFEYYAGFTDKATGQTIPSHARGTLLTFREPIGVCGLIVPWNFPLAITSWKVAPCLAMGNSVVVKPAEQTPLTALRLGELMLEAGIPPGVMNVITGKGSVVGEALVRDPRVRKIAFTGSTEVGRRIMQLGSEEIKRVSLELGGKSANIIFADADLDLAVTKAASSVLGNAGQDCCARSRILVERSVYEEFLSRLTVEFGKYQPADPMRDDTLIGPLITRQHRDRVMTYVESGREEGARVVAGSEAAAQGRGAFLAPSIFADVTPRMKIFREEIFGPVAAVTPFEDESQAIELANDSIYGLSGSIWTRDIGRALRVARAMETGVLSINTSQSVHLEAPFGGVKQSGVGRDLGAAALDHYSEWKSVFIGE